jgi:hypothetical protein
MSFEGRNSERNTFRGKIRNSGIDLNVILYFEVLNVTVF